MGVGRSYLFLFIYHSQTMRLKITVGILLCVSGSLALPQGNYGAPKCEKKRVAQPISYDCTEDKECTTKYEDKCETKYEEECELEYEQKCETKYEEQCELEYQEQCVTKYEQQCKTEYDEQYEKKCETKYDTVYEK